MQRPGHLKNEDELPYTLMLTLRVWVVFSCLWEEDVSALQHGTVFIVIRTGFRTNNDRRLRGYVKTPFPLKRLSSHNACVFLHITVRCSHYRCLYTRIYYVRRKIAKHLHPHTPSTHLSPLNHTQTLEWQLVPCKPEISLDCSPTQYSISHCLLLVFIG